MATLDTQLREAALKLIDDLGKIGTFVERPNLVAVPSQGKTTSDPEVLHSVKMSPPDDYVDQYAAGDVIQEGQFKTFVAASALEAIPLTLIKGMEIRFDGTSFTITTIKKLYSGELIAAFELILEQ